jgi:hypothetical protein
MSTTLQTAIVLLAAVVAGWAAWRILRGRRVLGRGRKEDGCAGCSSQEEHRR